MSTELRDFLCWYKGWIEDKKKLNEEQLKRLTEKIEAIPLPAVAAAQQTPAPKPAANLKVVPGDPASDPRFTPETMPKMSAGAAMDAGPGRK